MFGTAGTGDIFGSPHTRTGFEEVMKDFGRGGLGFDFLKGIFGNFEFSREPDRVEFTTKRPGGRVFRGRVPLEELLGEFFGAGAGRPYTYAPFEEAVKAPRKGDNDIHEQLTISSEKAKRGVKMEYKRGKKKIQITIPPGVKTGRKVRYKGARAKLDGKAGDLYVHITVKD